MATRLPRRCVRCGNVHDRTPCPNCAAAFNRKRAAKCNEAYGSSWRRLRLVILARDPYCQIKTHCNGLAPSTEVDHIVPLRDGGSNDSTNLQGACKQCHSAKTIKEIGLSAIGSR